MKHQQETQTVDGLIQTICGAKVSSVVCTCGTCTYSLQNGMYFLQDSSCSGNCSCPATLSLLAFSLLAAVCPSVTVVNGTVQTCCGASALMGVKPGEPEGRELTELLKLLLGGYRFWRLASLGLGALSVVLAGVVVYLLARG